ncbi:hypothetical protein D1BOALGB6SA_9755 [Olavius sp. associated proteobacterium Delta 1]|nr:hypothetical protein D1BOALGB6SA_9755 [Olavius sp. associated proteobacterium Delta 1]
MKPAIFRRHPPLSFIALVFVLVSILVAKGELSAAPITDLSATGLDANGDVQSDGGVDANYRLTWPSSAAVYKMPTAAVPTNWYTPTNDSAWIGLSSDGSTESAGTYNYRLDFDLAGFNPETAEISGSWASDNDSKIYLNGIYTGDYASHDWFDRLTTFTISGGFQTGINTLTFSVTNRSTSSTGLLVANLAGEAALVPIPRAIWLLGSALIGLVAIKGRLRA